MQKTHRFLPRAAAALVLLGSTALAADVTVASPKGSPRVDFGMTHLEQSLRQTGDRLVRVGANQAAAADIAVSVAPNGLGEEDFRTARVLSAGRIHLELTGGAERGVMYGLLDVAEQLRLMGSLAKIPQRTVRPRTGFRAIKFNLPWMSYRKGEALQLHMETARDLTFWRSFLDMMAEDRFNTLTLWNLHPFTFMIRPKNFPEASGFTDAQLADWQNFYHTLFRMARDRGIDTYVVDWNTFVSPEFAKAHNVATYSEDWSISGPGDTSELVERYLRECVTQLLDEYPELTGLGITLGERMGGMTSEQRRDWIERVYFAGMRASKHHARLIYRAPLSADTGASGTTSPITEKITRESIDGGNFEQPVWVELKYNWSHGHSSPNLYIVHGGAITGGYWDPMPKSLKVVWTMRNEDFFVLRWAEPGYIREAIANNSQDWVGGFIIGSECYIPAKDYIHADNPHRTWKYAFERQWLFYSLWGRLLFDPTTPDAVFAAQLSERYGASRGADLLKAWETASRAPLHIASFYEGTSDPTLYSEGFAAGRNRELALITVDQLINRPTLDPSLMSIADFVKAGRQAPAGKTSPLKLADTVEREAAEAMRIVQEIRGGGSITPTLDCELMDIESWAWMDRYFAEKLRGGVALATFRTTGDAAEKQRAVADLETAATDFGNLARLIHSHDNPVIPNIFDANFSWTKLVPQAQADVETARTAVAK